MHVWVQMHANAQQFVWIHAIKNNLIEEHIDVKCCVFSATYTNALRTHVHAKRGHSIPRPRPIHAYVHTFIHTHTHTYTYIHTYTHACMYTCIHTCIHMYRAKNLTWGKEGDIKMLFAHIHYHLVPPKYIHVSMHTYVYTCFYAYTNARILICTNIRVHAH